MKLLIVIASAIAVCSANIIKDPYEGYKEGDRFFYFPGDGDGIMHLVDTQAPIEEDFLYNNYGRNSADNAYWLYTRANPAVYQVLINNDEDSVDRSNFNPNKVTVVVTHGWNGDGNNENCRLLVEAFLQDDDVNVIVLDWKRLASRNYISSKNGVAEVGRGLGQFLLWLNTLGLSFDKVHLVGFSLGGHLVGTAARETGSLVKRITALDPAGPLWGFDKNRLTMSDAQYVEVIHTTISLGYEKPCGHADFYPNGGSGMPGCFLSPCSHGKAYQYMAASVKFNHFSANECASHKEARRNNCTGDVYEMGNSDIYKSRSGIFRVDTGKNYPY